MSTYKTSEIASIIGIHPNTVRLYEKLKLIPKPARLKNGYRVFTDFHVMQFKLARIAFQIEVMQNGLRKKIVDMVKLSAEKNFDSAILLANEYLEQIQTERHNAEEAIKIVQDILSGKEQVNKTYMRKKEVSEYLDISVDTLRNWEMNGLLSVKRKQNGYRIYSDEDIKKLKVIRSLRCANYSLESILRMLHKLSKDPCIDIKEALNFPNKNDDIVSVCDELIVSLSAAEKNIRLILNMLEDLKINFL